MMNDDVLKKILSTNEELVALTRTVLEVLRSKSTSLMRPPAPSAGPSSAAPSSAAPSNLPPPTFDDVTMAPENDWEDPRVYYQLKKWNGDPMKGLPFSKTSAEFLKQYAHFLVWLAGKQQAEGAEWQGKPKAPMTLKDAGRALRWAERLEQGIDSRTGKPGAKASGDNARKPDTFDAPMPDDLPF